MQSLDLIGSALGGFAGAFLAYWAFVDLLIDRALQRFKNQLTEGDDGFITRREAHLAFRSK